MSSSFAKAIDRNAILTALLDAGWTLVALREYHHSDGATPSFSRRDTPGRRMGTPAGVSAIPLMDGLVERIASGL